VGWIIQVRCGWKPKNLWSGGNPGLRSAAASQIRQDFLQIAHSETLLVRGQNVKSDFGTARRLRSKRWQDSVKIFEYVKNRDGYPRLRFADAKIEVFKIRRPAGYPKNMQIAIRPSLNCK
jgi:hypothetical protein